MKKLAAIAICLFVAFVIVSVFNLNGVNEMLCYGVGLVAGLAA